MQSNQVQLKNNKSNQKKAQQTGESKKRKSIRELGVAPLEFHFSSESDTDTDDGMVHSFLIDILNEERRLDFVMEQNKKNEPPNH